MSKYFSIGKVVQIDGSKVTIWIRNFKNFKTISYNSDKYIGVFVGSFVGILSYSKKIVVQITKDSIINIRQSSLSSTFWRDEIPRELVANIIGVLKEDKNGNVNYETGANKFPLIFDDVVLLNENELKKIFYLPSEKDLKPEESLGISLVYGFPVHLPNSLSRNHIAIFGTTGSGKTNTIKQLYCSLFYMLSKQTNEYKKHFVFFDFNDEYSEYCEDHTKKIKINGQCSDAKGNQTSCEKWNISKSDFWKTDFFAALLNILENKHELENLINELKNKENLKEAIKVISELENTNNSEKYSNLIANESFLNTFKNVLELFSKFINFDDNKNTNNSTILIFEFDKTNMKDNKIISSMITKILYEYQKNNVSEKNRIHLIIDEANNILSENKINETEEKETFNSNLFEKIAREGKKYNFFLIISIQDPWTINSKIISQLDHFFIHKFKYSDLEKIKPIINLHDSYYNKLPILNAGECVILGSELKTPLLTKVKVDEKN